MRRKVVNARIDLRTTPQRKSFFEFAAVLGKYNSLSSFITEASEMLAKKVFEEAEDSRELSDADRDLLLKVLNKAPEPNAALKASYERVAKLCHLDQNGETTYELDVQAFNRSSFVSMESDLKSHPKLSKKGKDIPPMGASS